MNGLTASKSAWDVIGTSKLPVPQWPMLVTSRALGNIGNQQLEFSLVVHQPIQIKQALVDDVLTHRAFVLKDDWAMVFVQAQRVNATPVRFTGGVPATCGCSPDPDASASVVRQIFEAGFCVGKETFRHLQPGQLSEINELLDQVAPRRLAL
jgi:hypothetical protein